VKAGPDSRSEGVIGSGDLRLDVILLIIESPYELYQ